MDNLGTPIVTDALQAALRKIQRDNDLDTDTPCLIGVRGYSFDGNKRGIYDDAIFLVEKSTTLPFLANTDPSQFREGIATLETGIWQYQRGLHGFHSGNPYPALVQAGPVRVLRDGGIEAYGMLSINIHKGGLTTTGSEGCQTIHPYQWSHFINQVSFVMTTTQMKIINYILVDRQNLPEFL